MQFVCDLQGFKVGKNKFIAKEVSSICLQDGHIVSQLFKQPFEWHELSAEDRAINKWVTKHFHNIPWNFGLIPYDILEDVVSSMLSEATLIYVKGCEKKQWLRDIIGHGTVIIDLGELGCPSLSSLQKEQQRDSCMFHVKGKYNCARRNVQMLADWIQDHSQDE